LFILLNMSSTSGFSSEPAPVDDRTTRARIRDAAITCFTDNGITGTTVRKIAAAAEVSPGLVIHHFGSMEGLRAECDDHVAESIRRYKRSAISEGPNVDVLAALRGSEAMPWLGYLVAVLADDSPTVARLVDELVADAEGYLALGVETGVIRPSPNPRGRAAMLLIWSLGALVLHQHVERILGVDLTDPNIAESPTIASYAGPVYEIMGEGVLTAAFAERLKQAFPPPDSGSETTTDDDHPTPSAPASKSPSEEPL
jgi:AcrR family transcriptional regulator